MDSIEIKSLDKEHIIHSWVVNDDLDPFVIKDVEGPYLIDGDDNRILDFACGSVCVNVGHKHPKIVAAIQEQAEQICYIRPSFTCESRAALGKALAEVTPGDLNKFFFTVSGAESNENAIKMARFFSKKQKILARYISYHGASYGAATLTGDPRRIKAEPGIPGVIHVMDPYCYRCPFKLTYPQCDVHCAEYIRDVIGFEDPATIAAIIVEPVTGSCGCIIPPDGYLQRLRNICDENEILLIADEIMVGLGRTGRWFAVDHWDVVPDIMTMAKGLTNGYLPLGAVAVTDKVSDVLYQQPLSCGLTYLAHPLCCAAGIASIEVLQEEKIVENSKLMGQVLVTELAALKEKHACVGDARSLGLMACLELVKNKKTREPLVPYGASGKATALSKEISKRLKEKGLFTIVRWLFLFVTPPLNITESQLRHGLAIIDEVLDFVDEQIDN
jgi:taurine--2-oxoglutarate transaminase